MVALINEADVGIRKSSGTELLAAAPYLRKWLHSCGACGHTGHRPNCPDTGYVFDKLKRSFPHLDLNQAGLCVACERATEPPRRLES